MNYILYNNNFYYLVVEKSLKPKYIEKVYQQNHTIRNRLQNQILKTKQKIIHLFIKKMKKKEVVQKLKNQHAK